MAGEEDVTVLCAPFTPETLKRVPGNVLRRCAACKCRVVASPPAITAQRKGARIVCLRCGQAEAPYERAEAVPGAQALAAQLLGEDVAKRAVETLARFPLGEIDMDALE